MNRQKIFIFATVLVLVASTAGVLAFYNGREKLGQPGIKTRVIPGAPNLEVLLPERVLNYFSEAVPEDDLTRSALPPDTSYAQRLYKTVDGSWFRMYAVLMGTDRTSLHKPQICMPGQGFVIEKTEVIQVPVTGTKPYNLPVIQLTFSKAEPAAPGGQIHGMFVYWFVADGLVSADDSALHRMWLSSKNLLLTGELQRWAYVGCYTAFPAGGAEACTERARRFIADAVPQFHTSVMPAGSSEIKP